MPGTPSRTLQECVWHASVGGWAMPAGTANVGYWVRTSQTGQGIATAAVRLIAWFGFEDLGLLRLELLIAADNPASRRIAEKVGATFERVLPAKASRRMTRTASR